MDHHDEGLEVALEVPEGWEVTSSEEFPLLLLAPVEQEFRANVGVNRSPLDPPTVEHLADVVEEVRAKRAAEGRTVVLEGERPLVQDGAAGWLLRSRWLPDEPPVEVVQIAGMFLTDAGQLYQVHCTTLAATAEVHLPAFKAVLDSLRFS